MYSTDPSQAVVTYRPILFNRRQSAGARPCGAQSADRRNSSSTFIGTEVPGLVTGSTELYRRANGLPDGMMQSRGIQWAPRLGFSSSPYGSNGKMVVRGGGGVSYTRIPGQTTFNALESSESDRGFALLRQFSGLNGATPLQAVGQSTGVTQMATYRLLQL